MTETATKNILIRLFELEISNAEPEVRCLLLGVMQWMKDPRRTRLRRTFTIWYFRRFLPKKTLAHSSDASRNYQAYTLLAETVEQLAKDWKQQVFLEGLEQGIRLGEASALKRQLIWRFKVVPPEILDRIEQAMPEQVEQWLDNLLEADTLEAVFKGR